MLGHTWRLRASNTQNQAVTVTVTARYWKFAPDGALVWSAEQTLLSAASVPATTGTTASSTVDNSTDKWLGADLTVSTTAAAATNGTGAVALFLDRSTDGGTTWPTAGLGELVGAFTLIAGDGTNARLRNLVVV